MLTTLLTEVTQTILNKTQAVAAACDVRESRGPLAGKAVSARDAKDSTPELLPGIAFPGITSLHDALPISSDASFQAIVAPALECLKVLFDVLGGGLFFWWQLGAVHYLQEQLDLTAVPMQGASCGSLVAALTSCGVSKDSQLELAYNLCVQHNVFERPAGLAGVRFFNLYFIGLGLND